MNAPILFIHYGYTFYLKYTLHAAILFNPDKRIILLGDDSTSQFNRIGVEHFQFDHYSKSEDINLFEKGFRLVAGTEFNSKTKGRIWTKFCFKKWFVLYNFIVSHNIDQFWIFDSDNMILTNLSKQENKFLNYDCTEQCQGMCMNGFFSNRKILKGYIDKINDLFQREDYLKEQMSDFDKNPTFGFTMMRAYRTYKEESKFKPIRLNTIINGESFDDCICFPEEMETYDYSLNNRTLKKIYLSNDGNIFTFHIPSKSLVKLNSINLSWVPEYLFKRIYLHSKLKLKRSPCINSSKETMKVLDIKEGVIENVKKRIMYKFRNIF